MPNYMDPKVDYAFKRVFGDDAHKNILICFLNATLNLVGEDRIVDVKHLPTEYKNDRFKGHDILMDLYVTDQKGSHFIVEMQRGNLSGYSKRMLYYFSTVFNQCLESSQPYAELPDVVVLSIVREKIFPSEVGYLSRHCLTYDGNGRCYIKGMTYVFIELAKFNKQLEDLAPGNIEDRWCYFLKHALKDSPIPSTLLEVPEIGEAYQILDECNWLADEVRVYQRSLMANCDEISRIDYALKEGLAKGKAEGLAKGKAEGLAKGKAEGERLMQLEMAKKLKNKGFGATAICELTGLTQADVENLND